MSRLLQDAHSTRYGVHSLQQPALLAGLTEANTPEQPRLWFLILYTVGILGIFLGHPNPFRHLPLLALWTPCAVYLLAWNSTSYKKAFLRGWLTGTLGNAAALYWITEPITNVGGLPFLLSIPAVLLLGCYLGIYTGLCCLVMRSAQLCIPLTIYGIPGSGPALSALASGLAWGGLEYILGWLLTGFPWLCLSAAFVPWPSWIQAAAIIGSYGLSAAYAAGACSLTAGLLTSGNNRILPAFLALFFLAGLPLSGSYRLSHSPAYSSIPDTALDVALEEQPATPLTVLRPLNVLMVQGNIDQNQKWVPEFQHMAINKHLELTQKGLADAYASGQYVDLVLWSETAMPFYFHPKDPLSLKLGDFARQEKVHLAFGTLGYTRDASRRSHLFNRVQFISREGSILSHYDKEHLVPFGEYTPLDADFEFLKNILQGVSFAPGTTNQVIDLPLALVVPEQISQAPSTETFPTGALGISPKSTLALGMLICYEVIFTELAQQRVSEGASVLLTVSNDAWFGTTSAPRQHLHLAALRAVEQARPLIRATNTGYSASIDAYGRISGETELFMEGASLGSALPNKGLTVYHRLYPLPQLFCLAVTLALFICAWVHRSKRMHNGR